jgi:putative endopeptidase
MNLYLKLSLAAATCLSMLACNNSNENNAAKSNFKFIDYANMDTTIAPGDDFFQYANGQWLNKTQIPGDKTRWGSFDELRDRTNKDVHKLLDQAFNATAKVGTPLGNVGIFYKSGMDTVAIEALGITPIKGILDEIDAIKSNDNIMDFVAKYYKSGIHSIISGYIFADEKDVNNNIFTFGQTGLGLPTKDYYFKTDANSIEIQNKYKAYLATQLKNAGIADADAQSIAIYNLEKTLAGASLSPVEMRNPELLYNKYTPEQFTQLTGINFNKFVTDLGVSKGADSFIIQTPKYYTELGKQLKATSLATWKAYFKAHIISDMSPYLSSQFSNAHFDFFDKTLSGQAEQKPRWERVMNVVNGAIGDNLGKLYVDEHFKPEAKKRMVELVANLQNAFHERITKLDWMSDATKNKAIAKLNTFIKKIGYPEVWKTYDGLELSNNYVQNVLNASAYEFAQQVKKLGTKVDRKEWLMTPNTVNAYYNPVFNEIVFPAAILQFPFFDFNADDAINYGGIGAVIGHEMTHGFDDQGCQYDAEGYLRNWWTEEDAKLFQEKTGIVVEQFNNYTILEGKANVNGLLTLGENIADLGGMTIAYDAFKKTKQGQSDEKIDGFTPDQRFFLSWAQIWRTKATEQRALQLLEIDNHSPGEWRCNGPLSQFEPFYKAFNIKEGDKMFVPVEKRAKVW